MQADRVNILLEDARAEVRQLASERGLAGERLTDAQERYLREKSLEALARQAAAWNMTRLVMRLEEKRWAQAANPEMLGYVPRALPIPATIDFIESKLDQSWPGTAAGRGDAWRVRALERIHARELRRAGAMLPEEDDGCDRRWVRLEVQDQPRSRGGLSGLLVRCWRAISGRKPK